MKKMLFAVFMASLLLLPSTILQVAFCFEIERPSYFTVIDMRDENSYTNGQAAVGVGVHLYTYHENDPESPYAGRDGITFRVVATANTREGVEYSPQPLETLYDDTFSPPFQEHQLNLNDDDGVWINLPFQVAFYTSPGGLQSQSLYSKVWVCSNGFLCFDNNSTSPNPKHGSESPNTIMAPYWSDLDPTGGIISYWISPTANKFVVSWYNILDKKNNIRQTFEIIIHKRSEIWPDCRVPNKFAFQYRNVTWSSHAQLNVEDQVGLKGYFGSPEPSTKSLIFYPPSATPAIQSLSIKIEKQDSHSKIIFGTEDYELSGVNLKWTNLTPIGEPFYEIALKGFSTLLLGCLFDFLLPGSGLLWDIFVVGMDTASAYSAAMVPVSTVIKENANETENLAYVNVPAAGSNPSEWPIDASLASQVYWVFTDDNTLDHSIKVTAELTYYSWCTGQNETVATSVNLTVPKDAGNTIAASRYVVPNEYLAYADHDYDENDYYNISVFYGQYITLVMHPPESANFDLYLYNKQGFLVAQSKRTGSQFEDITYRALYTGPYYVRVNAPPGGLRGFYTLKIEVSDLPPGGCPFVGVWNGTHYAVDNNLMPSSELNPGLDVDDYYKLEHSLIPKNGIYCLVLSEFEHEHSYFDNVKLFAIDHDPNVNVAVSPSGEILTYANPYAPLWIVDENGNDWSNAVGTIDEQYYQGDVEDYLLINFGSVDVTDGAKLILRANQDPIVKSPCIHVQVLASSGEWIEITTVQTRVNFSIQVIDLENYLMNINGELTLRLYFTAKHKIDYIGLDTTPEASIQLYQGLLILAHHSTEGFVTHKLLFNDSIYTELLPNQQIKLAFLLLPNSPKTARSFILYSNGYYYKIR